MKSWALALLIVFVTSTATLLRADTFGAGANTFEIEFVTIGDANNPADTTGDPNLVGSVPYVYRMGKFAISEDQVDKANAQSLADGIPLGIVKDSRGPNKPATSIDWWEAARFVNWLNIDSGSSPAYKYGPNGFELWQPTDLGYNPNNLFRNSLAKYFLPNVDEWYKAAFYDPATDSYFSYATGSNTVPVAVASGTAPGTAVFDVPGPADVDMAGGLSPFGTMGQSGNVWEWEETEADLVNDTASTTASRGWRGGDWFAQREDLLSKFNRGSRLPSADLDDTGFRVASVAVIPEPSGVALAICGLVLMGLVQRHQQAKGYRNEV